MIIQGVAGSGKTSVALHRVAFMLYKFKDNLKSNNIVILSPNKVFGDYISTVLPELGEEPILQTSLRNIADIELDGIINFHYDEDIFQVKDDNLRERIRYKSKIEFLRLIEEYFLKNK